MSHGRWRRFLPERSQLWILAVAVVATVAAASFANLATARSVAQNEKQSVQAQVDSLNDQNRRLRDALTQDSRGDNIEPKARDYFGMGFPDETRVVIQAAPTPDWPSQTPSEAGGPPYWLEWWKRLTQP